MKESLMHIVEDIINAVPVFERNNRYILVDYR